MFKKIATVSLCLATTLSTSAYSAAKKPFSMNAKPFVGYRQDTVKWSIGGGGGSAKWRRLKSIGYGIKTTSLIKGKYQINLDGSLGNVLKGSMVDSGYFVTPAGSPPAGTLKARGMVYRANLGGGYKFTLKPVSLTPLVGYSYDSLKLKTSGSNTPTPVTSLRDTIHWHGPWLGGEAVAKLSSRLSAKGFGAYYVGFYRASGYWRTTGVAAKNNLKQSGTGQGITGKLALDMKVAKSSSVGLGGDIYWRKLKNAHDTRTLASGTVLKSKREKVNWTSFATNLTFTQGF